MSPRPFFASKLFNHYRLAIHLLPSAKENRSAPCHIAINRIGKIDDSLFIIIAFKHYGMVASP